MFILLKSKQQNIQFVFCPSPITIDKRASWGDNESNFQHGPNGAFLKMVDSATVSHLVQPKDDLSAPIGWVPTWIPTDQLGRFDKSPIWIDDTPIDRGEVTLNTKDGTIVYTVTEPSYRCYNMLDDGNPDLADSWIQTVRELDKNYITDLAISQA